MFIAGSCYLKANYLQGCIERLAHTHAMCICRVVLTGYILNHYESNIFLQTINVPKNQKQYVSLSNIVGTKQTSHKLYSI